MDESVSKLFDDSLLETTRECVRLGYTPSEFIRMIHQRGGVNASRSLLHNSGVSSGFTRLWELGRMDLTVEAQILRPEWRALFTDEERRIARERLREYRFTPSWDVPFGPNGISSQCDTDEADDAPDVADVGGSRPNGGMFGVKLIYPDHLGFPHLCGVFPAGDRRVALMNFKNAPRNIAAAGSIPVGHRALVFTRGHVVWAIEFIGPIDDGQLLGAHGVEPNWPSAEWTVHRPIRFLARMSVDAGSYQRGMHRREIEALTGVTKRSYGSGHFYITEDEYNRMYSVVPWDWTADGADAGVSASRPRPPARATGVALPPIPDAESFLAHVRSISGQPERNMEDAVKEFLVRLGHPRGNIRFQIGHIDVTVTSMAGEPLFVFEVKRSLASPAVRVEAMRQGFDYAGRVGARFVVITDADRYEVFDRTKGLSHDAMRCGEFQLTAFRASDTTVLDLLRHGA
jgi:hypothetical protein